MLTLQVAAFVGAAVLLPTGLTLLAIGLRRPPSSVTGVPAEAMRPPRLIRPIVPTGHDSTAGERLACRARLGPEHGRYLVVVADLLARRPAALRGIAMDPDDLPIDDLVAVSAYLHGVPADLDRSLRAGAGDDNADRAVVACLRSGLRRFPVRAGACHVLVPDAGMTLAAFRPGQEIVEPAFLRASTGASAGPDGGRALRFAFWSRTGRDVSVLDPAGPHPGSATVLFAPGTRFRVLATEASAGEEASGVVFLSESCTGRDPARRSLRRRRELARLRRSLSDGAGPAADAGRNHLPEPAFTPGLDDTGRPYQVDQGRSR